MLILSCFYNQHIFIIITTPLYGFLPTLAAILAILRASSLSDGERERQREQEEQYILKSMMTKSERERERERDKERERERDRERERERERIPRERYINKRSKLNIQTITLTYLTTAFPAGTI